MRRASIEAADVGTQLPLHGSAGNGPPPPVAANIQLETVAIKSLPDIGLHKAQQAARTRASQVDCPQDGNAVSEQHLLAGKIEVCSLEHHVAADFREHDVHLPPCGQ